MQLGCHPVAVVQYTFTHKQYTEQHNETEYTEQNIGVHNNKNTQFSKLNRNIQNIQPYIQWYKIEPKEYERKSKTSYGVYRGADKSLGRPGRKQATATEDFEFHTSYL